MGIPKQAITHPIRVRAVVVAVAWLATWARTANFEKQSMNDTTNHLS